MVDDRIACGAGCTWWDSIDKVGKTAGPKSGSPLPCCPHCSGMLFEFPNLAEFMVGAVKREKTHPGYLAKLEWARGKCFISWGNVEAAYAEESSRLTVASRPMEPKGCPLIEGPEQMTDARYMRPGLDFAVGKAIEEAGEFNAAIGKTLRWGWHSVNPELPVAEQEPNHMWVRREIADLRGALDNLEMELVAHLCKSKDQSNG